ncbi:MAG: Hpt domain-containing protein [bacterium]
MTLKDLYQEIGGNYDQAMRILRMERLLNKHICKFSANVSVEALLSAGEAMDAQQMFESAHALKGVSGNLGLTQLYELSTELSEEFRPGNARQLSDAEVAEKLSEIKELHEKTADAIKRYQAEG